MQNESEVLTASAEGTETAQVGEVQDQDNVVERKLHEAIESRKNDAEALAQYTQELLDKKRSANSEAKKYREELESLKAQVEKEKSDAQLKDMSEVEQLKAQFNDAQTKIATMEQQMQEQLASEFDLEVAYASEKHRARNPEFIEFLLEKHLNGLSESGDTDELAEFDVSNWMGSLKKTQPDLFGEVAAMVQKGNFGNPPKPAEQEQRGTSDPLENIGRSRGDRAKLMAQWDKKKAELSQQGLLI